MKTLPLLACALLFAAGPAFAAPPSADEDQVRTAFARYDDGWRTYDADQIVAAFADDFEWTNEVGLRFTDKRRLQAFFVRIFKDADFRAGKPGPLVIRSVRMIDADTAVVSSTEETDGQVDRRTGKAAPALHTNELTVMRRMAGQWLIVDDLTSDESHGI